MCFVLGVIADESVALASKRALEKLPPLRLSAAAVELPGAVHAHRPLVIIATPKDRFGHSVVPYLANVRGLFPQIGVVWISDISAKDRDSVWDLSATGDIRSASAASREYATDLRDAVEEQAERYREEYILRAFAPHAPTILLPLLQFCARTWGKKLTVDEVAASLKRDRHTITRWLQAVQPACGLGDVLRWHHFLDITWRLWARREPYKLLAREFRYRRPATLRGRVRHWLHIDVREPAMVGVQSWEHLVDRFVEQFTGRHFTRPPDQESSQH